MALDETTAELYRAADTSTLLGLLPLLRSQVERASTQLKHIAGVEEQAAEMDAQIAESYGELMATLSVKGGEGRELIQDIRDKINSVMGGLHVRDERTALYTSKLLGYSADLTSGIQLTGRFSAFSASAAL